MLHDFDLIVSTSRGNENKACTEIWFLLGEMGDRESIVRKTGVSGLIVAKTAFDPFKVIENLREMLRRRPEEFRYTLKIVPIEIVVRSKLDGISRASAELVSKIEENENFRVSIEKRHSQISSHEIIENVARNISRRVDLDNPDKIVLVEVLKGYAGISVIKPTDILSIVKEKP